jgi:signal transduction histidine kinase
MDHDHAAARNDRDYGLSFTDTLHACLTFGVITVNHNRIITAFSSHAEQLTSLSAGKVLDQSIQRLQTDLRRVIQRAFESGEAIEHEEVSLAHGPLRVSAFPSLRRGRTSVTVVLNDLAPVQKLERNARQLDRLASVGALSASMAHEIKNAMVAIRTFVELLIKEHKGAELADVVSREMRRIDSIVSQMLRLAGPARPTFALIHVHTVLDHALHLVQHQLDAKKLRASRKLNARTDRIRGDDYQLEQAFLNLFFNAIEAMGPGGELTITTENDPESHSIRVGVSDTGLGIPPEKLGRLFEAFFTTKRHGTGLGLLITRRIIEEHNGTITVESEPKKGTTFQVTLPT